MWKGEWRQTFVFDVLKLVTASVLLGLPWVLRLPPGATWNLSICGYLVVVASLAELLAEADWEREVNVCIGAWLIVAPWVLGFSHHLTAALLHLLGGSFVSVLVALASHSDRSPPWQFRPGAALRARFFRALPAVVAFDLPSMGVFAGGLEIPPQASPTRPRSSRRTKSRQTPGFRSRRVHRAQIRSRDLAQSCRTRNLSLKQTARSHLMQSPARGTRRIAFGKRTVCGAGK
jgi:SPW repeat